LTTGDPDIDRIFKLSVSFSDPIRRKLAMLLRTRIERILMLTRLNAVYSEILDKTNAKGFIDETLQKLGITYEVSEKDLASIPRSGPVMVVANHPFGGIEGLVLCSLLLRARPDTKIMANYLLGRIPELRPVLLCVDPFGTRAALKRNLKPLRDGMGWLKGEHVLAVFPAGTVSHLDLHERKIVDPKWHESVARIAHNSGTTVLPVFFDGANGPLFQAAGMLHPTLRTALLPRQLLNMRNKTMRVRVGNPIPYKRLGVFESDEKLVTYLRMRT
jgi:putative hemolysin